MTGLCVLMGATNSAAVTAAHRLPACLPQVIYKVVAFQPRVLMQSPEEVSTLIRLWSKFSTGIDDGATC